MNESFDLKTKNLARSLLYEATTDKVIYKSVSDLMADELGLLPDVDTQASDEIADLI